jgi:hypothetical protein
MPIFYFIGSKHGLGFAKRTIPRFFLDSDFRRNPVFFEEIWSLFLYSPLESAIFDDGVPINDWNIENCIQVTGK